MRQLIGTAGARLMVIALVLAGCQSDQAFLDGPQPAAIETALARAKFELSCPDPASEILSRSIVQPGTALPRFGGFPRAQYTIGVTGCGQKATYVVFCSDETNCFASEERR
jgi:hypothetical protein